MPRYRANARFGPWGRGSEFESDDPFHAALAADGRLLVEVKGPEEPAPEEAEGAQPGEAPGDAAEADGPPGAGGEQASGEGEEWPRSPST